MSTSRTNQPQEERTPSQINLLTQYIVKQPIIASRLDWLSNKTGISKPIIVKVCYILLLVNLILGFGSRLLSNVIGFIYPVYQSIKALELKTSAERSQKIHRWLIYWVVFTVFHLMEIFADFILSSLMFYDLGKAIFLIWCMYDKYQGSTVIYEMLIGPILTKRIQEVEIMADSLRRDSDFNFVMQQIERLEAVTGTDLPNVEVLTPRSNPLPE